MRMNSSDQNRRPLPFIADLCAHLSEAEVREAEDRFWGYVEIVRRIHERRERERVMSSDRFDNSREGF